MAVETSDEAAYVLTAAGRVFRRCGITSQDYVGTAWREVPAGAGTKFNRSNLSWVPALNTPQCQKTHPFGEEVL